MPYIENPKTKGSGIYCAIPQTYKPCPQKCSDCFFSNGRSYLEPLAENLPNIPPSSAIQNFVIRVNDGLDSGQDVFQVIRETELYPNKFYNTADPGWVLTLSGFGPVVLTINPAKMTDRSFYGPNHVILDNLMFVRFRANTWNQELLALAVKQWCGVGIPLVITYMRYYDKKAIPSAYDLDRYYNEKDHILNPSWSINEHGWDEIYSPYQGNPLVSTCGANVHAHLCKHCGVCLREYWRAKTCRSK